MKSEGVCPASEGLIDSLPMGGGDEKDGKGYRDMLMLGRLYNRQIKSFHDTRSKQTSPQVAVNAAAPASASAPAAMIFNKHQSNFIENSLTLPCFA